MEEKENSYHVPVMLDESVKGLNIQEGGIYVDVTFGGGGHSREILKRMDSDSELYGFDQDADAEHNIPDDPRFVFVRSNFRYSWFIDDWLLARLPILANFNDLRMWWLLRGIIHYSTSSCNGS